MEKSCYMYGNCNLYATRTRPTIKDTKGRIIIRADYKNQQKQQAKLLLLIKKDMKENFSMKIIIDRLAETDQSSIKKNLSDSRKKTFLCKS